MIIKRNRGRPTDAGDLVGRSRIIDSARQYLREKGPIDVTRKAIAERAEITPALISYYFRDREELIRQCTVPLITAYNEKLESII